MQGFKDYITQQDEGLFKNLAIGGALLGAGIGLGKHLNKPAQPQQAQQAQQAPVQQAPVQQAPVQPGKSIQSPENWNYVSPRGIKVALTDNSMGVTISMPTALAERYGGQSQKVALTTLANYFRQEGGPNAIDTMNHYKLQNIERGADTTIFRFQMK